MYDSWPEQQGKAQQAAEQRRRMEELKGARKEAEEREVERRRKEEEEKKAVKERAKVQREQDQASMEAARGLAMTATTSGPVTGETDEEAQMRAIFRKMREFNAKNPKMLARLWDEERQAHVAKNQSAVPPSPVQAPAAPQTAVLPAVLPAVAQGGRFSSSESSFAPRDRQDQRNYACGRLPLRFVVDAVAAKHQNKGSKFSINHSAAAGVTPQVDSGQTCAWR